MLALGIIAALVLVGGIGGGLVTSSLEAPR